jgi:acetolactate synthase-1/2/3 large subunit
MGYAIPAAIGGYFALPENDKTVTIALAGDGGAMMNGNELKTAAEHDVPVFFFVFNDGRLNIIYHSTEIVFGKPNPGSFYKKGRVDFAKLAEAYGVESYVIDKPGQINKKFIESLIAKKKPILFDCRIDENEMAPIEARMKAYSK